MKKNLSICFLICLMSIFTNNLYAQPEYSIEEIQVKAKDNDVKSQIELAHRYKSGEEVELDLAKSFYWMLKAANQNNEEATIEVALMYGRGQGTPQNPTEAFKWFSKYPNNNTSVLAIGYCYLYGYGTVVNYKLALFNYQKSYNYVNSITSMEGLIHIYKNGLGVPVNMDKVIFLETKIKEEKNLIAQKDVRLTGYEKHRIECDQILKDIKEERESIVIENEELEKSQKHIDYLKESINNYEKTLKREYGAYTNSNGVLVLQQISDITNPKYWGYRDIKGYRQQAVDNMNYAISNHNNRINLNNDRLEMNSKKVADYNKNCADQ